MADKLTFNKNQLGLETEIIGFCMIPGRSMGCYIPNLMSDIPMGNNPTSWKESLSTRMIKNSQSPLNIDKQIQFENFIILEPNSVSNVDPPSYNKGENFRVTFLDNDIKKGLYSIELNNDTLRQDDRYRIYTKDGNDEYHVLVDSSEGVLELKTSNSNHGKFSHTIQINQKEDTVNIKDNCGNYISMNSDNDTIELMTSSGAGIVIGNGTIKILGTLET